MKEMTPTLLPYQTKVLPTGTEHDENSSPNVEQSKPNATGGAIVLIIEAGAHAQHFKPFDCEAVVRRSLSVLYKAWRFRS